MSRMGPPFTKAERDAARVSALLTKPHSRQIADEKRLACGPPINQIGEFCLLFGKVILRAYRCRRYSK